MAIENLSYRFRLLQMFIKHTHVSEDTKKSLRAARISKIGRKLSVGRILVSLCFSSLSFMQAQIQTDGSLGSAQSLSGPDYVINENLGRRAGNNLFHSFNEFSIRENESATFRGASEIANVISRVTGGSHSNINGLLKSEIANANFYLINSAGILFGPNASLSINGSFHASTADYVRLGNDDLFYNNEPPEGDILSTAAPRAFGFFEKPKGNIVVDGSQLDLDDKATLSLVGGKVTIEDNANIRIPQGQINVVGVNSRGEVRFDSFAEHQNLKALDFAKLSSVNITNNSELNTDGEGGGRIVIRGGELVLRDSTISARTIGETDGSGVYVTADRFNLVRSRLDTTTVKSGNAGEVLIDAENLVLNAIGASGETGLFANSAPKNELDAVNPGKAGTIKITADQVSALCKVAIETKAASPEYIGEIVLSTFDGLTPELTLSGSDAEFQFSKGIGKIKEIIPFTNGNIVLDGSLHPDRDGETLSGPCYEITENEGRTSGNNLFYSFSDFFVDEDQSVAFFGSEAVSNIIVRVTGDNSTSIYGPLISNIKGANLYLINPNGLFFGPHDKNLDLQDSFSFFNSFNVGTADYLTFSDGGRFDISDPDLSVLSSGDLSAYGFIGDEIGEIMARDAKIFLEDKTISLIGGSISLENSGLLAPFGHINLVSLQSAGEAFISNDSNDLEVSGFSAFGNIILNENSPLSVTDVVKNDLSQDNRATGRIFVRGNHLKLDNKARLVARNITPGGAGGSIDVGISGDLFIGKNSDIDVAGEKGELGQISIVAENVRIDGSEAEEFTGISAPQSRQAGTGEYSLKMMIAKALSITNRGIINLVNNSDYNAKDATIKAENLIIAGQESGIYSTSQSTGNNFLGTGDGGNLEITVTEDLKILNGGKISTATLSKGNAGNAIIEAGNLIIDGSQGLNNQTGIYSTSQRHNDNNPLESGLGNGGNLEIEVTENLKVLNGGRISAFAETSDAGSVSISAENGNIYIVDSLLSIAAKQEDFDTNNSSSFQQPELFLKAMDIWLENSELLAQAGNTGGNMNIDTMRYIVISSEVTAQADIQGGNYNVLVSIPNGWIQSTDSPINLSGEQSGSILSNTSPFDLGAELSDLNLDFLNVEEWAIQPCKSRLGGSGSSFIVNSWRGVSNNADDFLPHEPILLENYDLSEIEPMDGKLIVFEVDEECENCP